MFGCTARTGLLSIGLPNDEINSIKTEEDIEKLFNQMQETGLHNSKQNIEEVISPISEQQENIMMDGGKLILYFILFLNFKFDKNNILFKHIRYKLKKM